MIANKNCSAHFLKILKNSILSSCLFFTYHQSIAQNQANIWYFGEHAGLDFNSGKPIALTDGQTSTLELHNEGSSIIANDAGNLLMYSDGVRIWNSSHTIMPNGNDLMGNISSTNAAFIVPLPLNSRYFYVFTQSGIGQLEIGLRYSVVDMCLDNELGDVMPSQKNILLEDYMTEKIAVVRHANGVDYWIVTHKMKTKDFYAFLLTPNGLEVTPVLTSIGSVHQNLSFPNIASVAMGQMKISPNGKKLALCFPYATPNVFELFDFDTQTGKPSNVISFADALDYFHVYGIEFSPDSRKIYAATTNGLLQANLDDGADNIVNSSLFINRISLSGGLQLATNGKIYLPVYQSAFLSSIDRPNALGMECNFNAMSVNLGNGESSISLPSFIAGFDYSNTTNNECDKPDCENVLGGDKILDDCGNCFSLGDPEFNASCTDCAGTINGSFGLDECGNCLLLDDPEYNASCTDCAGSINGSFVLDDCGNCLLPDDPEFKLICPENELYIPNAFSPNDDNINNTFQIFGRNKNDIQIKTYIIYNRYANKVYEAYNFDINSNKFWWDGFYQNIKQSIGVYVYFIEAEFLDGSSKSYKGNVTLVR